MQNHRRTVMIRIPHALHERISRLAKEILAAKERGQGYDDIPIIEQGKKGVWVPHYAVIERALNDFEAHRARSNPKPSQRTK